MSRIAIVTDTNSSITPEDAQQLGIYLLPMPIIIDEQEYFEGLNCQYEEFFDKLAAGSDVSTSQPSPLAVTELWDKLLAEYDSIVHIPMSSALSSSCEMAKGLALDYDGRVQVVDNRRISILQRRSAIDARDMAEAGLSAEEIARRLEEAAPRAKCFLAVNTLELLKKSGRVTASGAAIGTLLNIKPVLKIEGDKLDAYAKCRGMQRAQKAMLDAIRSELSGNFDLSKCRLDIAYSGYGDTVGKWQEMAQAELGVADIEVYRLPLSISCHVGAGVLAIGISEIQQLA